MNIAAEQLQCGVNIYTLHIHGWIGLLAVTIGLPSTYDNCKIFMKCLRLPCSLNSVPFYVIVYRGIKVFYDVWLT